ncbi:MAG: hypothetical protein ACJ8G5_09345 [Burkholderiales bacterium]
MIRETVLIADTILTIELHDDSTYMLRYGDLVEYSNGRRRVRGRAMPYAFRSVEQLRYDFEQDVRAAGGTLA